MTSFLSKNFAKNILFVQKKSQSFGRLYGSNQTNKKYDSSKSLSPAVLHILAVNHITDTSPIVGTGPRGRILKGDVLQYIKSEKNLPQKKSSLLLISNSKVIQSSFQDKSQSEFSRIRANLFAFSKRTIPHLYLTTEVKIDDQISVQKEINAKLTTSPIGLNEFILRASALALREVPEVNISYYHGFVQENDSINIAVTLQTSNGVISPVIKNVDHKGLASISQDISDLMKRASNNQLTSNDMEGGCLSISTLDVNGFIEVVQPPQVAALTVGKERRVVVPNSLGLPSVATICEVTLSCDQRIIDETIGGRFLNSFRKYLSQPHFL